MLVMKVFEHKIQAYKMQAHEMHAYKMHDEMHDHKIVRLGLWGLLMFSQHPCQAPVDSSIDSLDTRVLPLSSKVQQRCTPIRCMPIRCMPIRARLQSLRL